jgi:putative DNA primase/helicase
MEPMSLADQIAAGLARADGGVTHANYGGRVVRLDDRRRPAFSAFCTVGANGNLKFAAPLLGEYIAERSPVAAGGGRLYVYSDGVYREGEQAVRLLITELLGTDEWNRSRAEETIAWLQARAPRLNESPPVGEVNVLNGVLVVKRSEVELRRHDPKTLSPIQLPVKYDPKATCPRIEAFLARVFPDESLIALLLEIAGYLLVPDNTYQRAFMLHGPGGNGKSRVLGLLTALLGPDNVSSRQLHDLDDNRFACADLYGRLANICADISARELNSSSKFKAITGGDRISGERKHQPAFDFMPFARLLFSANEFPSVRDGSKAFYDRWVVLPCEQSIRGAVDEDNKILDALTAPAELSGFLNLALQGLARLRARHGRFTVPQAASAAVKKFRLHADSVAGFVAAYPVKKRGWVKRSELYKKYQAWCLANGRHPLSNQRFYVRYVELVPLRETRRNGSDGYVLLPD